MKKASKVVNPKQLDKTGAVTPPLYRSAGYEYQDAQEISDVFAGKEAGYLYTRLGNPTVTHMEQRLNQLENGLGAVAFGSGMAAIANVILTLTASGQEIISSSSIYSGTYALFANTLPRLGIQVRFFQPGQEEKVKSLLNDKTTLIYCETIGNPKMDVVDIKKIVSLKNKVPLVVDATLTPPTMFQGKDHGVDIVVHSTTKYISGQGRSIGGVVIDTGLKNWKKEPLSDWSENVKKRGRLGFLTSLRGQYLPDLGACMAPEVAEQTVCGLETLDVRMTRALDTSMFIANALAKHSKVKAVHYLGLPDNQFHEIAKSLFDNHYGAFMTIELEDQKQAFDFINHLSLIKNVANVGDVRTLVLHPWSTQGIQHSEEARRQAGITPGLVRLSIGIEDKEDLWDDIEQALEKLQ